MNIHVRANNMPRFVGFLTCLNKATPDVNFRCQPAQIGQGNLSFYQNFRIFV